MTAKIITRTLSNGSVLQIPDSNGCFILSCGCGSGKTTMYKDIIKEHWKEGILYAVDSRKECLRMYRWIKENIVGQEGLKETDIWMMFTKDDNSNEQIEAENKLNLYKQNPEILLRKKIVIIPHPRLFSDIPGYFLVYNDKLKDLPIFDGDFKALMSRDDLRQWILIDETPQFFKPLVKFPGWLPLAMEYCGDENGVRDIYNRRIKGFEFDPFKNIDTKLGRIKRDVALKMLPNLIPEWMNNKQQNSYSIQFYPKDLVQEGMKTHLYQAEGAGDILFSGQKRFELIDVECKYKSKLELKSFPFGLDRKKLPGNLEKQNFLNTLKGIIDKEPQKVLIVVWKDFKGDCGLDDSEGANESKWRDEVQLELLKMGVSQDKFYITYYGASDSKSTNEYRDCGSIVCCGKWMLPGSSTDKLNSGYDGHCDANDYNLYQYVQLICRIGLRNHTGETYRMYYSDDFLDKYGYFSLGDRLCEYINNNKLLPSKSASDWKEIIKSIRNDNRVIKAVNLLLLDGKLKEEMLLSDSNESIEYSLRELSGIIPKSKKPRKDDYNHLVKILKELKVDLVIT